MLVIFVLLVAIANLGDLESGRQRLPLNLPLGNYKCTAGVRFFDMSEGPTTEVDEFETCKYYRYNVTLHCY